MRYGNVPGIEKPVSRVLQGTASFTTHSADEKQAVLDAAFALGINCFDTARVYGDGNEKGLAEWVASRGIRDKVVILAKGAHHGEGRRRVTPEDIEADLTKTLDNMQLDNVDLYILHRDDENVPAGVIVEALNEHQKAGRISAFGGSNWTHERIQEANDYAAARNLTPFAVSSPNYSLAEQVEEPWDKCVTISGPQGEEARKYYAQTQIALMPWSSLAGGFWSGRFTRENYKDMADDYFNKLAVQCYCYPQNFDRMDRVRALAQKHDASIPQIALAFVLCQPMNVFPLMFGADRAQLEANAAALDIDLTPQEMAYLDLKADRPE